MTQRARSRLTLEAGRAEIAGEPVKPEPLLRGRDLIERGPARGPEFEVVLDEAYELQLEGTLLAREEALAWLRRRVGR